MREIEARSSRKCQSRVAPAITIGTAVQTTDLVDFTFGLLLASGAKSMDGLTARLGDEQILSVQKQALATGIGNLQGNQHLQRVIEAARQTAPAYQVSNRAIQRSALSEAQTRAGTPSSGWAQLSGLQLREMAGLVRAAEPTGADQERQQALERLAAKLGLSIPGTMSLEVTTNLGKVQGATSNRAASGGSPGKTPRHVMLEHWLSRCPQDFSPSTTSPGVNDPVVLGRISAQIIQESAFRSGSIIARLEADIRAIAQTIR